MFCKHGGYQDVSDPTRQMPRTRRDSFSGNDLNAWCNHADYLDEMAESEARDAADDALEAEVSSEVEAGGWGPVEMVFCYQEAPPPAPPSRPGSPPPSR